MEINHMANPAANPLHKHFRQPAIYIRLPSQGQFYPENTLDLSVTGEIPVYPMTVRDEITLKTPDALMNSQGMVDVVKSCCPNIRDPWRMPAIDVDAVFIAIRIASYGAGMDVTSTCPHCKEENEHTVDLRSLLDRVKSADFARPSLIDDLIFNFKPQQYRDINQVNLISFEEQRIINGIVNNDTLTEQEKKDQFQLSFNKLKEMNVSIVVKNINSITTEDGIVVSDQQQITEFLDNCSRSLYDEIRKEIQEITDVSKIPAIDLECTECTTKYQNNLEFDQANFFA